MAEARIQLTDTGTPNRRIAELCSAIDLAANYPWDDLRIDAQQGFFEFYLARFPNAPKNPTTVLGIPVTYRRDVAGARLVVTR